MSTENLSSLAYRSRAAAPLSVTALRELERSAQARNRAEGLSGFAIYDDGRFFQWLEGPAEALSRVWDSIRKDPRHADIEGLGIVPADARVFSAWDMALAIHGADAQAPANPATLSLVAALDPLIAVGEEAPLVQVGSADEPAKPVVPFVRVLSEALVLPQLVAKHGSVRRFLPPVSPVAARLAKLLVAHDPRPSSALIRGLFARAGSLAPLCATVFEPAARLLGDLWLADGCSQFDMTSGLYRLQASVRRLTADATQVTVGLPAILVAPQPGEVIALGSALDAELLWQAGWDTHSEFPETNQALQALLSETWFDVLDLSLSPALHREESLAQMAETIAGARAASRNPTLTVVTSGRSFFERCDARETVGADASTASSLHVVLTVTSALRATAAATATATAEQTLLVTSS